MNFIKLNQSTATSLKKRKKLESSSCMQWVGGLVSTIIRRYQGSCTLLRYCSSAGWVHEVCPDRELILQESVRICVAVVCLLFFFRYLHTNHFYHKDVPHISGISKHVKFWGTTTFWDFPEKPHVRNYIFLVPTGCNGDLKKKTTTFARHPCVAGFLFSHSQSFSRTNPSNVHQKKMTKNKLVI